MARIVLVPLSPVYSKRLLLYEVLPGRGTNVTYSGVAKSSRVIAVKVLDDDGWVPCIYLQGLAV